MVHLHHAAEGVVQHGVQLGAVALLKVDGVTDAGRGLQRGADALLAGGEEAEGQVPLLCRFTDDIPANDTVAAILYSPFHRAGQLHAVGHEVAVQLDAEQVIELRGIAEHVGKADQSDTGALQPQLLPERQHQRPQLLRGDPDLHHRDRHALPRDARLYAAGNDQLAALLRQLAGPRPDLIRPGVLHAHRRDVRPQVRQRKRHFIHIKMRNKDRDLCHFHTSPFSPAPL